MDTLTLTLMASLSLLALAGLLVGWVTAAERRAPEMMPPKPDPMLQKLARERDVLRRALGECRDAQAQATAWKIAPVRARVSWPASHWIRT